MADETPASDETDRKLPKRRALPPLPPRNSTENNSNQLNESQVRQKKRKKKQKTVEDAKEDDERIEAGLVESKEQQKPRVSRKREKVERNADSSVAVPSASDDRPNIGSTREETSRRSISKEKTVESTPEEEAKISESSPTRQLEESVGKKRKKSRNRRSESARNVTEKFEANDDTLNAVISDLGDDLADDTDANPPVISVSHLEPVPVQSQPTNKCYIEQKNMFKIVDKKMLADMLQRNAYLDGEETVSKHTSSALHLALSSHRAFRIFATFCHGLLGGICLWNVIVTYVTIDPYQTLEDFVDHYTLLAQPFHSLSSFLLAVCVVSVFDRYEFGRMNVRLIKDMVTFRQGAFVIVIYLATFLLNLCIIDVEDKLNLYRYNDTWWRSLTGTEGVEDDMSKWKLANLCRCIGSVIGWMMISCYPYVDHLLNSLKLLIPVSKQKEIQTIT